MRLLLCSHIHCDKAAAERLVDLSKDADVLVCAGDLAVKRQGLQEMVDVMSATSTPAVLVAGNGESTEELRKACEGWVGAHVLHGNGCSIDGIRFWGVGGAIPLTPFGAWRRASFSKTARVAASWSPIPLRSGTSTAPEASISAAK